MAYRIGKGIAIIKNQVIDKFQLCLVEGDQFIAVATFDHDEDASDVFMKICEIRGLSEEENEMLKLYNGTSKSMQKSITDILRVSQEADRWQKITN